MTTSVQQDQPVRAFDRIVAALRRHGAQITTDALGVKATCPAHPDRGTNLRIIGGLGSSKVRCSSGCTTESVLAALGLQRGDLVDADPALDTAITRVREALQRRGLRVTSSYSVSTSDCPKCGQTRSLTLAASAGGSVKITCSSGCSDAAVLAVLGLRLQATA